MFGFARGMAAAVALLGACSSFATAQTVSIDDGAIEGRRTETGLNAFLGVPYAAPPVHDLRWREPQAVKSWPGVFHADRFAPQCMQPQRGILTNQYSGAEVTSEDCLYLNVWAKPNIRKAPVIVFLHGGGFFVGSGGMALYSGEGLAQQGAVVVNPNYRLGPLGFLAHPELTAESKHGTSGNYGFLDQIAALRWVRDNIARFGGDPSNVTIVGQSAGSMSVLALQASPLAKGLFHRAVGMSGAIIGNAGPSAMRSLPVAENDGVRLQEIWKAASLAELRALPADRLVTPRSPGSPAVGPIEDGYVLPGSIASVFAAGEQSDVPLLLGYTSDETLGGLGAVSGLSDYRDKASAMFGGKSDEFLGLYPATTDEEAIAQARLADRDNTMVSAMDLWARAQAANGKAPVFSYMFSREHSYPAGVRIPDLNPDTAGAYHTSEVPFWLGTLESFNRFRKMRDWTPADRAFSLAMTRSLVAFARSGNPDVETLDWVAFDPANPRLLNLGSTVSEESWPDQSRLTFFRSVHRPAPAPSGTPRD